MYIDYKVTVWRRMRVFDPIYPEALIKMIQENNRGDYFQSCHLFDVLDEGPLGVTDDSLDETEEAFPLIMNNGSPTVELYDDNDNLLYDNINGEIV